MTIDRVAPGYLADRVQIARMARALAHMDEATLNNPHARLLAYESSGALGWADGDDITRLDKLALESERARQRAFGGDGQ